MPNENKTKWTDRTQKDISGWWSPEDMAPIQGIVKEGKLIIDKQTKEERLVWFIELTQPTMLHEPGAKDAKEFPKGSLAGVGHRAKLNPLIEMYATTEEFEVRIVSDKQVTIQGGRKMWLFKVATTGGTPRKTMLRIETPTKNKQLPPAKIIEDAEYETTDDIPF